MLGRSLPIAIVLAIAWAAPAGAAYVVGPGGTLTSPLIGGCGRGITTCALVQDQWRPEGASQDGPLSLPFRDTYVLTRLRLRFYDHSDWPEGKVALQVARAEAFEPGLTLLRTSRFFRVVAGQQLDVPIRVPVAFGNMLAIAIEGRLAPYFTYEDGGEGSVETVIGNDADAYRNNVKGGGAIDGVLFDVTAEPDGDRDGFGDESQDRCPAAAGTAHGCPRAAATPAPVLDRVRRRGRRLAYRVLRAATLRLRVQRRRGHRWRTVRALRPPGRRGTHRIRLPRGSSRARIVLRAYGRSGRRLQTVVVH